MHRDTMVFPFKNVLRCTIIQLIHTVLLIFVCLYNFVFLEKCFNKFIEEWIGEFQSWEQIDSK